MKENLENLHPFLHAATLLEKRVETQLVSTGVRHRQGLVLDALARSGELSQRHLAKQFDVTPGSMSTMVDRLQRAGYLTRHRDPGDRRRDLLALTAKGERVLDDVRQVWQQADEFVAAVLGQERPELFGKWVVAIRNSLGGSNPEDGAAALSRDDRGR